MTEFILIRPPFSEPHLHPTPFANKPCGNPKELPADSLGHLLSGMTPQSHLLEPVHEVVGQYHQLEVQLGARPVFRDARIQTETVDAFLDEVLAAGTLVVAVPDIFSRKVAVSGDNLVVIEFFLDTEQLRRGRFGATTF